MRPLDRCSRPKGSQINELVRAAVDIDAQQRAAIDDLGVRKPLAVAGALVKGADVDEVAARRPPVCDDGSLSMLSVTNLKIISRAPAGVCLIIGRQRVIAIAASAASRRGRR
jgi:hypothetical protein